MGYKIDLSFLDNLESTFEDIKVTDLEVDPEVQRPEDLGKIRRIFNKFTVSGLGTLTVSRRSKPTRNILLDGQTRWQVLLRKPPNAPEFVRCEVFNDLTRAQEAALFVTLNDGTKPRAVEMFRLAVTAGDPVANSVMELLNAYDIPLAVNPSNRSMSAVDSLHRIWMRSEKRGFEPNTLQLVLLTVKRAWNGAPYSMKSVMLTALAALYDEYGEKLDVSEFTARLAKYDPQDLIFKGLQAAALEQVLPAMGLAKVLVGVYNTTADGRKRQGKSRLWDWGRRR